MTGMKRRKTDHRVAGGPCRRFGAFAVHLGFVTLADVKGAVSEQIDDDVNGREHRLLGSILYDKGLLTEEQIETVLRELKSALL